MDVPAEVTLTPDGFEVVIAGRRTEERATAAVIGVVALLPLLAVVTLRPTSAIRELLGLAVWMLLGVAGLLAGAIGYLVIAPVRTTTVRLTGFTLTLGTRRIALAEVRDLRVRHGHLVVEADVKHVVPASHTSNHLRRWVVNRLREQRAAWLARDGDPPPELEALRDR